MELTMKSTEIVCVDIPKHLNRSASSSMNGCLNLMNRQASGGLFKLSKFINVTKHLECRKCKNVMFCVPLFSHHKFK